MIGRIVIDAVQPRTPRGYPAKAVVGEAVHVSADIFKDGHDVLAARVRWRPCGNGKWLTVPMHELGNDRWEAIVEPTTLGRHEIVVEAWTDRYHTWRHKATTKVGAGQDIAVELEEGARLVEEVGERAAAAHIRDATRTETDRLEEALTPAMAERFEGPDLAHDLTDRLQDAIALVLKLFLNPFGAPVFMLHSGHSRSSPRRLEAAFNGTPT